MQLNGACAHGESHTHWPHAAPEAVLASERSDAALRARRPHADPKHCRQPQHYLDVESANDNQRVARSGRAAFSAPPWTVRLRLSPLRFGVCRSVSFGVVPLLLRAVIASAYCYCYCLLLLLLLLPPPHGL